MVGVVGRRGSVEGRRRTPRRLPRLLFFAVLATLLVLAVNSIVKTSAEGPDPAMVFADRVRPAVDKSTRQAMALEDLRSSAGTLGRDGLKRGVDRLLRESRDLVKTVEAAPADGRLRQTQGLLLTSLTTRQGALAALADTLAGKFETGPPEQAVDRLVDVGGDLAVSDRAYELFLADLPKAARASMPESVWLPDPTRFDRPEVAAFVGTLRASASLAPVRDLTVLTVTTDPIPVGMDGPVNRVLPVSKTLRLQVVVANAGNLAEKHVAVEAVVASQGGLDTARQFVDLGPGQRATVTLALRPSPIGVLELKVHAGPLEGEGSIADNEQLSYYVMR
ncbi:MAG TPA: hypothetical protein VM143_14100 [Acidimicrobiales bacterium]|nr:hypothetical protein [Acidimicrobiales bacterium]